VIGQQAEYVVTAWLAKKASDLQCDTLEVIGEMLSNGKAGLFDLNLNQAMRVQEASGAVMPMQDYSVFYLDGKPNSGQTLEEVRTLIDSGIAPDDLIYYGLEYKYVTEYVVGRLTFEQMKSQLEIAIHQFAKRQMTWFRGMERRGTTIHWIDGTLPMAEKVEAILRLMD
jgi:hypothetical protein